MHGAPQPQDAHPLIDEDLVFDTCAALWRHLRVFLVMIAVHIQHGHIGKGHQKRKIARIQIAAGNNKVNSLHFALLKKVPQIFRLLVRNYQNLHANPCFPSVLCQRSRPELPASLLYPCPAGCRESIPAPRCTNPCAIGTSFRSLCPAA